MVLEYSKEVRDLLDEMSDKLMQNGYLSEYILEGELDLINFDIYNGENDNGKFYELRITLDINDRESDIEEKEGYDIADFVEEYLEEKGFDELLLETGYNLTENNFDGFTVFRKM